MTNALTGLERALRDGTLRRRDFLAAAAALGISATSAGNALAQVPKRGGHLIVGHAEASVSDSFDPATWNAAFMQNAGASFYDTLTAANEKLELVPMLAESWEAKPGVKEWIFKLRKGATFHNGKSVTPADVIYSINYHIAPNSRSMAKSLLASVESIKATGPNEVTFYLSTGNADLPYTLGDWRTPIVPEGAKFDGLGTGPYVLESFEPGIRVRGKRFANDWNQQRGWADTVEFIAINDPNARLAALLSGAVHLINRVPAPSAEQVKRNPRVQLFPITGSGHAGYNMRVDIAPFQSLDLRLAMKYAINREALLKTVFRGYGLVANDQPIPPSYPFYAADIPQRPCDPDRAKFHYKKSGYTGPIALTVSEIAFIGAIEAAQLFQVDATKAGIEVKVDRVPSDGYYDKPWDKPPFSGTSWGGKSTSDLLFALEFYGESVNNGTHWKNEKFDQLLVTSRAESDTAKRRQMYHDMQQLVSDDAGTVLPVYNASIDAGAKTIRGFVPSPVQQMSGYRAAQMVWFDT